ncbi:MULTISPECIES: nucleotide sugar dehydrogenase [Aeribacillus]|jgi:UDP-N-acetyl-D-mannosaminuronic acid dehydrogenase|uniref:UDP-N-acetyl-D-mannosamine dehydrogenase n=1 Tax=Aeribacillus pallidus TaxID=33936 RepID=A0A165ZA13_9BACI|nr:MULTISPECIES: nucleotide sugar dehydrogenase [Aeribacillus]KZN98031.1 UDP-N-acetyl-D-mannosamine dehydrogenase [Aeribacillus pallidus]MED0701722.1 nucleotide sugar dehydrogenase [Aeribacillus composti]MED0715177.1 nucleotide sugar dehydrogenase [Aeribacillus composti]MED0747545.1 nucleotide sugar dehydrogenase [Aeribacillus composti]MED1440154.1 nucleotide sugar dehydrogenase [Aeribacillus composti]
MRLCVMGLGYIGLPTAVMFAKHGVQVHGVDVNEKVVNMLNNKELHIEEPGLPEMLAEVIDAGQFTVSTKPEKADAFIIAVPTPVNPDGSANVDYVRSATEMILPYIEKGNLVILESTVPPKTVENVMIPILEKSGLVIGEELYISHSPERVLPGKLFEELVSNDRIVGGINEKSSELTVQLYKRFVKGTIHKTDATTAEMVKLMENTYRDINIAFANELARIAEKLNFDVWEAIELANYHPRVNIHKPGPGVGGHCIAVDPYFIIEKAPEQSKLITLARSINSNTPKTVVKTIQNIVKEIEEPKIAVLGLAFKGNIDDMRESPSLEIIEELKKAGFKLSIHDPHVKADVEGKVDTVEEAAKDADLLVILTDHSAYKDLDFAAIKKVMKSPIVYDTRNLLDQEKVEQAGLHYLKIGSKL